MKRFYRFLRKYKWYIVGAVAVFYVLSYFKTKEDLFSDPDTLAIVNGNKISALDFKNKLNDIKSNYPVNSDVNFTDLKNILLRRMIINELLIEEANNKNITVSSEELNRYINNIKQSYNTEDFQQTLLEQFKTFDTWSAEVKERLLIEKVMSKIVIDQIKISEEELKNHYNQYYSERTIDAKVLLAQVFTTTRTQAEKAMEQLSSGIPFEEVATKISESPEAKKGGVIGEVSKGEGIELFDMAFDMKEGEITDIMQSDYGYHILKVIKQIPQKQTDFIDAKPYIFGDILKDKEKIIFEKWLEDKLKSSKIVKNVSLLESIE